MNEVNRHFSAFVFRNEWSKGRFVRAVVRATCMWLVGRAPGYRVNGHG